MNKAQIKKAISDEQSKISDLQVKDRIINDRTLQKRYDKMPLKFKKVIENCNPILEKVIDAYTTVIDGREIKPFSLARLVQRKVDDTFGTLEDKQLLCEICLCVLPSASYKNHLKKQHYPPYDPQPSAKMISPYRHYFSGESDKREVFCPTLCGFYHKSSKLLIKHMVQKHTDKELKPMNFKHLYLKYLCGEKTPEMEEIRN